MNDTAILKPKEGMTVRDPFTMAPLAKEGERKPLSAHWLRQIANGSVEIIGEPTRSDDSVKESSDRFKLPHDTYRQGA